MQTDVCLKTKNADQIFFGSNYDYRVYISGKKGVCSVVVRNDMKRKRDEIRYVSDQRIRSWGF
jgi:hypothetical protein